MNTPRGNRPAIVLLLVLFILMAACSGGDKRPTPPQAAGSGSPGDRIRRVGGVDIAEVGTEVPLEALPYPYVTPTPARAPTPVDGTYLRILSLDDVGDAPFPTRCLRCPPFFVHAGVSTLMLHEGRYWLNHQLSGFRSMGHYTVEGNTVALSNDPHCPRDRGRYRWRLQEGPYSFGANVRLSFELLGGDCVYEVARAEDLSRVPWRKIDPCAFRFVHLWPARPECA